MPKNIFWILVFIGIALFIFLPSFSQLQDLRQKNIDFAREIKRLAQENKQLSEEKRRLEQDPIYFEKVAREKMGLIREGEVVYRMTPAGTQEKQ